MRKFFYFAVIAIFTVNCSSPSATVKTTETNRQIVETNAPVNTNKSVADNFNQPPAANTEVAANANRIVVVGDPLVSAKNARKWEEKKDNPKDNTPIGSNITKLAAPAPDNSEVFSEMNAKGQPMETRVFKKHPQLAKIERLYVTAENPTITIYLKSGKKIAVAKEKIGSPLTDSADAILKAAKQN